MIWNYQMSGTTRIDSTKDSQSVKPELHFPIANSITLDRSQFLDTISNRLFTILKIVVFSLLLLAIILIFMKIYTQQGIVIMPFQISNNENLSGYAIADQLTAELLRIREIHNAKNEEIVLRLNSTTYYTTTFSTEQSLGSHEIVVPKSEIAEFSMADMGTIDIGSNSLSLGKLIIAFKNICPGSRPVTIIRGSLQRYGSNLFMVAVLEGSDVQSWMVRQPLERNNGEMLHEMIRNLSFMIAHDLPQSNVSAKTWEGLKYYTEALNAYYQYKLSGNPDELSLAGNYSLKAISSEKGYQEPFELLSSLESAYIMIDRRSDAIEYCNKTVQLDPTSAYGWRNKGDVLNNIGKYDEAIKMYDEAIRLDPKYTEAWNNKGFALNGLGKHDEAIKMYDEAIRLDPKYIESWNNKGFALNSIGKYDEAIKMYDEAIWLDPKYAVAWYNKGFALNSLGNYEDAIKMYEEAIRLDPKYAVVWNNKGSALNSLGKYDEAIKMYDEAIRLDPKFSVAWYNKGFALDSLGNYEDAIKMYEEAIRLDPKYAVAWYNKGFALNSLGKHDEAIKMYDEAIRLDPKYAVVWYNKGSALNSLGKHDEAIKMYDEAIRLDPKYAVA
jgi:tetratricopeptide (TPR) repeat protein